MQNKTIKSFKDLGVYQNLYRACILVMTKIIPNLPGNEKYDLRDQLSRSCKAAPRLIAEGYAKKHQKFGFQKYIDDAMAECNESMVCLEQVKDIYKIEIRLVEELLDTYDKSARQLFRLAEAWDRFKDRSRRTKPKDDTGGDTNNRGTDNTKDAFSLLEMLVVIFIMALIGTLGLANYRSGQRMNDLIAESQKIVSIFKQAQSMALTGYIPVGETERTDCGYGVNIDTGNSKEYRLFVDKKAGDPLHCDYGYQQSNDNLIQKFTLPTDITLSGDCTNLLFQPPSGMIYCNTIDSIHWGVSEKIFNVKQAALNRTLQIKIGSGGQIGVTR